jgi:hypothetical protein
MRLCGGDEDEVSRNAERCTTLDQDNGDEDVEDGDGDVDVKGGNADGCGAMCRGM